MWSGLHFNLTALVPLLNFFVWYVLRQLEKDMHGRALSLICGLALYV